MNQPTDERRIRQLLQRLKSADQQRTPSFGQVMATSSPMAKARPVIMRWAAVVCAAALLLGAFLFIRSQRRVPVIVTNPPGRQNDSIDQPLDAPHAPPLAAEIDFERLRQVVHDHCHAPVASDFTQIPLWTSPTESLLALGSDFSPTEE